jgi:hypothetical protein
MSLAAFKRPFGVRALPGILLSMIPIIGFFAFGYKLLCARTAMTGDYKLPGWKEWKALFIFGLGGRILQVIYLLPCALSFYFLWIINQSPITTLLTYIHTIEGLLIAFFVFGILAAIFCPASILNFVAEGSFRQAFSLQVLKRMATWSYVKGWFWAFFYNLLIIGIFYALVYFVGVATNIIWIYLFVPAIYILLFLPGITTWTLLGESWGEAVQKRQ